MLVADNSCLKKSLDELTVVKVKYNIKFLQDVGVLVMLLTLYLCIQEELLNLCKENEIKIAELEKINGMLDEHHSQIKKLEVFIKKLIVSC